jgi:hypothetical protein
VLKVDVCAPDSWSDQNWQAVESCVKGAVAAGIFAAIVAPELAAGAAQAYLEACLSTELSHQIGVGAHVEERCPDWRGCP